MPRLWATGSSSWSGVRGWATRGIGDKAQRPAPRGHRALGCQSDYGPPRTITGIPPLYAKMLSPLDETTGAGRPGIRRPGSAGYRFLPMTPALGCAML